MAGDDDDDDDGDGDGDGDGDELRMMTMIRRLKTSMFMT